MTGDALDWRGRAATSLCASDTAEDLSSENRTVRIYMSALYCGYAVRHGSTRRSIGLDDGWSAAVINRPVTTGDHLWSDEGGRAEIHIGSTAIRLGTSTNVDVLNLDDRSTQLRIAQGTLNVRVRYIERDGVFEIDTPGAAVLVQRLVSYRIDVDPNGKQTMVSVRFGEVNVSGPNANFLLHDDQ